MSEKVIHGTWKVIWAVGRVSCLIRTPSLASTACKHIRGKSPSELWQRKIPYRFTPGESKAATGRLKSHALLHTWCSPPCHRVMGLNLPVLSSISTTSLSRTMYCRPSVYSSYACEWQGGRICGPSVEKKGGCQMCYSPTEHLTGAWDLCPQILRVWAKPS